MTTATITETQQLMAEWSTAVEFHYQHAGWGYHPGTQTPEQGRRQGAERLATAELWARQEGYTVEWEDDWDSDHSYRDDDNWSADEPNPFTPELESCEQATLYDPDGVIVGSLGCIDDADDNYRRVVAAELALDVMP